MSVVQPMLTAAEAGAELELVDGELVTSAGAAASATALSPSPPPIRPGLEERNLFAEAERITAWAASASTRRQYGAIFRVFGDWLAGELGRAPVVGDLDADVIAAYGVQSRGGDQYCLSVVARWAGRANVGCGCAWLGPVCYWFFSG